MSRLIYADEAYDVLSEYYHQKTEIQHKALKEALDRVPTVDAEEVVRCKDCKFKEEHTVIGVKYNTCSKLKIDFFGDYDFCSYGEKVTE